MNAMLAGVLRGVLRPAQDADKRPPRRKPASLVYAVDDVPPPLVTLLNAAQHVGVIAINLVYPVLIFRAVDTPVEVVSSLLAMVIWSLAIGTFLQVYRIGPVGSGFMCPATPTATYLAPSLLAVRLGGLPMVFGMTIFAGLLEAAIAPLLNRLRAIFPSEISGLVILMIGISAGLSGLRSMFGADIAPVSASEWWVAGITLAAMVLLNVWGGGILRMVCALAGLVVGYVAAGFTGLLGQFAAVSEAPWIGLPSLGHLSWSFDATLIAPFAIASIAAAMKAAGTITVCQKTNDADWTRPDMKSVRSGVLADGLGTDGGGASRRRRHQHLDAGGWTCAGHGRCEPAGRDRSRRHVPAARVSSQADGAARRHAALGDCAGPAVRGVLPHHQRPPGHQLAAARCPPHAGSRAVADRRIGGRGVSLDRGHGAQALGAVDRLIACAFDAAGAGAEPAVSHRRQKDRAPDDRVPRPPTRKRSRIFCNRMPPNGAPGRTSSKRATFAALQLLEAVEENCWRAGPIIRRRELRRVQSRYPRLCIKARRWSSRIAGRRSNRSATATTASGCSRASCYAATPTACARMPRTDRRWCISISIIDEDQARRLRQLGDALVARADRS